MANKRGEPWLVIVTLRYEGTLCKIKKCHFEHLRERFFSLVGNILHCTKGHKRKREKVKGDYWCVYLVYVFDESS